MTWSIDGYELDHTRVRAVESRFGWDQVTGPVGDDVELANRSGRVWVPKRIGPGGFALVVWLTGSTEQEALDSWWDLIRVCAPMNRLPVVRRTLPSGAVIQCEAELVGTVQPIWLGRRGMRAILTFSIPGGLWKAEMASTTSSTAGAALPTVLTIGITGESTAPVEDATLEIVGPVDNPTIEDVTAGGGGDSVTYNATVPNGGSLVLDCATWGISATGGWSPTLGALTMTGPRFLTLYPVKFAATHQVRLSGTGAGAATQLKVTAAPSYR